MVEIHEPRFQVAIIGAGIGGLLLALLLQRDASDLQVDIYESAAELTELGAGIGMWPRSWEIVRELGLEDELRQVSGANDGAALSMHYRKADEGAQIEFYQLNPVLHTFHRAVLQKLLAKHVRISNRLRFHFSKRLASYAEPEAPHSPIVLTFADGSTSRCDLLIGSDGIRSAVRRTMYTALACEAEAQMQHEKADHLRSMVEPIWSGQLAYRGLVSAKEAAQKGFKDVDTPLILLGKDKNVVTFPISRGLSVNVVAFVNFPGGEGTKYSGRWVSTTTGEKVAQHFTGWEPSIVALCKTMENPLCWAVHTVRPLPTYVKGRVVIMGDAAHGMTPHQGAGASQALEDGFILAALLARPSITRATLPLALRVYDAVRRPFAQDVQARSRTNGLMYQLNALGWESCTAEESAQGGFPLERLVEIGREIENQLSWILTGSMLQERERAVKMLDGYLGEEA